MGGAVRGTEGLGGFGMDGLRKLVGWVARPLASRKVRVALATVVAAYLADAGLSVSEDVVLTILGVGVAVILGIAHEDAARAGSSAE
jgi:hypothetical protein